MWRSVSTEAAGWREALTDRGILAAICLHLISAALCATAAVVWSGIAGPAAAVLGTTLVVLGVVLVRLRVTGRP
jgi:hypothetical protein